MKFSFGRFVGLAALSLAASGAAHAQDTPCDLEPLDVGLTVQGDPAGLNSTTGHFYEVFSAVGIAWEDARQIVEYRNAHCPNDDKVLGHLVTVTSEDEDVFVDGLRTLALTKGLSKNQVWIGGYRFEDGWKWVNEGADLNEPGQPFPGTNTGPAYSNWASGEPNNSGGNATFYNENGVTLGRYHPQRSWNDEGAAISSIGGFIVEYDRPLEGSDCSVEEGGCQTIKDQTLQFPERSIPEGAKIGFIPFEFTDPRVANGTCGSESLTLFGDDGENNDNELIIPPYLCGSPKFIAVRVDAEELTIARGVVLVENFTESALPGNQYPDGTRFSDPASSDGSPSRDLCQDPIPAGVDPQYQDVVVWQTTNPLKMREVDPDVAGVGQFQGAAGEFTDSCGSSRGKTLGASYFVVGMHIDFGETNTDVIHERFVALTRYKLELLLHSIAESRSSGALLKNGDYNKMDSMIVNAIKFLDDGDYAGALAKVDNFVKFITPALYDQGGTYPNYEGEHISRSSNIAFMLRVKVIPYAGP